MNSGLLLNWRGRASIDFIAATKYFKWTLFNRIVTNIFEPPTRRCVTMTDIATPMNPTTIVPPSNHDGLCHFTHESKPEIVLPPTNQALPKTQILNPDTINTQLTQILPQSSRRRQTKPSWTYMKQQSSTTREQKNTGDTWWRDMASTMATAYRPPMSSI